MGLRENILAFKNWPLIYLARRGFVQRPYLLKAWSGQVIEIRPEAEDAGIVKSVFARGSYVSKDVSVPRNAVVVDVGANIGAFSIQAAAVAAQVYAFEPEPRNHERLCRNIELNGFKHVTPIRKAVAAQSGVRDLHLAADENTGAHSLRLETLRTPAQKVVPIETVSIGDFMEQEGLGEIDFLKLDCEGSEWEILGNLSTETAARIHRIAMELHPIDGFAAEDAVRLLKALGYRTAPGQKANYLFAFRTPDANRPTD